MRKGIYIIIAALALVSCGNDDELCFASLGFLKDNTITARIDVDGETLVDGFNHNEVKEVHVKDRFSDGMHKFELYAHIGDSTVFQSATFVKFKRGLPESFGYLGYSRIPGEKSMIKIHACPREW